MYGTICELIEKQLENIDKIDHEYRSLLINLKLTNSLFYKIIPAFISSSVNWYQSYFLKNIINLMLIYVDKSNKVCILIIISL